jgi:hypothetical protein
MSNLPTETDSDAADRLASTLVMVRQLIFPKLSLVYGQRLLLMFEGVDDELVKADWANELQHVSMDGITYALKHLPASDFPPNIQQFRRICSERPVPNPPREKQPALIAPGNGSRIPAHVREFADAVHGKDKAGEEPRRVRTAREFLARYGNPGQVLTQIQREWLPHFQRVVENYDRTTNDRTKDLQAQTAARVEQYQQENGDVATHD